MKITTTRHTARIATLFIIAALLSTPAVAQEWDTGILPVFQDGPCYWFCWWDSVECYDSDCDCDPGGRCWRDVLRCDLACFPIP